MKKRKQTLFWEIYEEGQGHKASYLFGTMHVNDQRAFEHIEALERHMAYCDAFATEIRIEEISHQSLAEKMRLPGSLVLSDLLSKKEYDRLRFIFRNLKAPDLALFAKTAPIHLMGFLSNVILGQEQKEVLDVALSNMAEGLNLEIDGLESVEDHIYVLDTINLDEQVKMLKAVIKNFKKYRLYTLKMAEIYYEGDIQRIYKTGRKSTGKFTKVLLKNRNHNMTDSFSQKIQNKRLFAAIGAGHLGGKFGMISLLKRKNLQVKPILL